MKAPKMSTRQVGLINEGPNQKVRVQLRPLEKRNKISDISISVKDRVSIMLERFFTRTIPKFQDTNVSRYSEFLDTDVVSEIIDETKQNNGIHILERNGINYTIGDVVGYGRNGVVFERKGSDTEVVKVLRYGNIGNLGDVESRNHKLFYDAVNKLVLEGRIWKGFFVPELRGTLSHGVGNTDGYYMFIEKVNGINLKNVGLALKYLKLEQKLRAYNDYGIYEAIRRKGEFLDMYDVIKPGLTGREAIARNFDKSLVKAFDLLVSELKKEGFKHLEINDDNLMYCHDGRIALIDFGAAVVPKTYENGKNISNSIVEQKILTEKAKKEAEMRYIMAQRKQRNRFQECLDGGGVPPNARKIFMQMPSVKKSEKQSDDENTAVV